MSFWTKLFQLLSLQLGFRNQTNQDLAFALEATQLQDWVQVIDLLHVWISKKQLEIDLLEVNDLTFNLIEVSGCLLQMDLCVSKNKRHYEIYALRAKDFNEVEKETHLELMSATIHCQEVHQTMLECLRRICEIPIQDLKSKSISKVLKLLENQTQELGQAIRLLSDAVFKKGPLYRLFENDIFVALYEIEQSHIQLVPYGFTPLKESTMSVIALLREKAQLIQDTELKGIAFGLINQYELLNKYMIFSASKALQTAFKIFYNNINRFIQDIINNSQIDEAILHQSLNSIFRAIESIRFIANKKDSFTKNLQDAAKLSKKQLYKSLEKTQKGQVFLNLHQRISPKEKFILKSRFK